MLTVPPRRLERWAEVPGTRTTFAANLPMVGDRRPAERPMADLTLAYDVGPITDPDAQGVRIDFQHVVEMGFAGAPAADANGPIPELFGLCVTDVSERKARFLDRYVNMDWRLDFGRQGPDELVRHFTVTFDDLGTFDLLAIDCLVRPFRRRAPAPVDDQPVPPGLEEQHLADSADLWRDALALGPAPPMDPFVVEEG